VSFHLFLFLLLSSTVNLSIHPVVYPTTPFPRLFRSFRSLSWDIAALFHDARRNSPGLARSNHRGASLVFENNRTDGSTGSCLSELSTTQQRHNYFSRGQSLAFILKAESPSINLTDRNDTQANYAYWKLTFPR